MHPFSLTDEQVEQVSGAYDPFNEFGGTSPIGMPGMVTFGIGETGHYPYPYYEQAK